MRDKQQAGMVEWAKTEIPMLQDIKEWNIEKLHESQRRKDLLTGIMYGLVFGIMGNLLVQLFYSTYEKSFMGINDTVFYTNILFIAVLSLVMIFIVYRFDKQLEKLSGTENNAREVISEVNGHIERFRRILEQAEGDKSEPKT